MGRRRKTITDRIVHSLINWYISLPQAYVPDNRDALYKIEFCKDVWKSLPETERNKIMICAYGMDYIIPLKHIKDLARTSACG